MILSFCDIQNFYKSPRGVYVKKVISNRFNTWLTPGTNLVCGYVPFVKKISSSTILYIPFHQMPHGAPKGENIPLPILIGGEEKLPFLDDTFDRIVMCHTLEFSKNPHLTLKEMRRVLKNQGHILIITPNRRGIWSHFEETPFGYGTPYTMTQLCRLVKDIPFKIIQEYRLLYTPPQHLFKFYENIGPFGFQKFSGLIALEAQKINYAGIEAPALFTPCFTQVPLKRKGF